MHNSKTLDTVLPLKNVGRAFIPLIRLRIIIDANFKSIYTFISYSLLKKKKKFMWKLTLLKLCSANFYISLHTAIRQKWGNFPMGRANTSFSWRELFKNINIGLINLVTYRASKLSSPKWTCLLILKTNPLKNAELRDHIKRKNKILKKMVLVQKLWNLIIFFLLCMLFHFTFMQKAPIYVP